MSFLRDTWLVFGRYMWLFRRNPVWVIIGVIQPVFYLILFAPLLYVALRRWQLSRAARQSPAASPHRPEVPAP